METSEPKNFSIAARLKSVGYALEGIALYFRTQHNALIQGVSAVIVIILGLIYQLDNTEWSLVILAIAMVMFCEMLNTAIEFLTDMVEPEMHPKAKRVKDVAAGAVLIASIAAAIIGLLVFLPKFMG